MCTAFSWQGRYFGRNLDLEYHYREAVVTLGRRFVLPFRHLPAMGEHYAIIGIATVEEGYPLFYDAMNEHGLCVAALHFVKNAYYQKESTGKTPLAPYELIPYLLSRCRTVEEAARELMGISLVATPFSEKLPLSELHFLLSDKERSLVIEPRQKGLKCYQAPSELLTNNPPYPFHLLNQQQYERLSAKENGITFSRGLAAFGLPGDFSSSSRFVRGLFVKDHACFPKNEKAQLSQCFHILASVSMVEGCIRLKDKMPKTVYSAVLDKETGVYAITTYDCPVPLTVSLWDHADGEGMDCVMLAT